MLFRSFLAQLEQSAATSAAIPPLDHGLGSYSRLILVVVLLPLAFKLSDWGYQTKVLLPELPLLQLLKVAYLGQMALLPIVLELTHSSMSLRSHPKHKSS